MEEIVDEDGFASTLRKFSIPELNELKKQQMNEAEEEGEIKDEGEGEEEGSKKKSKSKKKAVSSSESD